MRVSTAASTAREGAMSSPEAAAWGALRARDHPEYSKNSQLEKLCGTQLVERMTNPFEGKILKRLLERQRIRNA